MAARRKVVEIDEERCDGCGLCVKACAEGAITMVAGKARLVGDAFCDGLGACLGECPRGAIRVVEREAAPFDREEVERRLAAPRAPVAACPGSGVRAWPTSKLKVEVEGQPILSSLGHWPVQLMLVPPHAPYLVGADLLVCADCVPFAVPDFHARYLHGRAVLVGCPKLDDLSHYAEKLRQVVQVARPRKITALRMEVPCCSGIARVTLQAAAWPGAGTPVEVHTVGIKGGITVEVDDPATTT
jgi:ferredoxin